MNKNTKQLVPKLRFPEFQDDADWTTKPLGNLAKLITEKAGNTSHTLLSVTAGVGLVTQLEKFGREIAGDSYKNYVVIEKGDFAYNKSSTKQHPEGQVALLEKIEQGAVPNSIFTCFRVDKGIINPYFLKYPFANNIHGKWLRNFIAVGARANGALQVDSKDLLSLPVDFPSLNEQQKIVDCLSSIDDLITAQSQKVEALKTHKKGLMQQLFPREGETVPRLRFPEFRDAGEWVIGVFDNAVNIIDGDRGVNYPKAEEFSSNGFCVFLNAKNVTKNGFAFDEVQFISQVKDDALRKGKLKRSDVILTTRGSVGHFAIFSEDIPYDHMRINSGMVILRLDSNLVSSKYLYSFCKSEIISSTIEDVSYGNAQQQLTVSGIKKLPLYYPKPEEQQKIADCLSSIDDLISAHSQKLESLKNHKKGLMQQLFPSTEADSE